jgi:hypothetical protein
MAANWNIQSDSEDSKEDYFSAEEDIDYKNANIFDQNNIIICIVLAGKFG